MAGPEARVLLFNNDILKLYIETMAKKKMAIEMDPHVRLYLRAEPGPKDVTLELRSEAGASLLELSGKIVVKEPNYVLDWPLRGKVDGVAFAAVRVSDGTEPAWERNILIRNHTVSGRLVGFPGQILGGRSYVLAYGPEMEVVGAAKTDEKGRFSLSLPEGRYAAIAGATTEVETKTLQSWMWGPRVDRNLELTLRIGEICFARMTASLTPERSLIVHCVPHSIYHSYLLPLNANEYLGDMATPEVRAKPEYYPKLSAEGIELFLDSTKLEVWAVWQIDSCLADYGRGDLARPALMLEAHVPRRLLDRPDHMVRIVGNSTSSAPDRGDITERGEAWCWVETPLAWAI